MGDASSGPKAARISAIYVGETPWCASFRNSGFSASTQIDKETEESAGGSHGNRVGESRKCLQIVAFRAVKHRLQSHYTNADRRVMDCTVMIVHLGQEFSGLLPAGRGVLRQQNQCQHLGRNKQIGCQ